MTPYERNNPTPYGTGQACHKLGYATKREAKNALRVCKAIAEGGVERRREDHVYRCGCGGWHLTSHPNYDYLGEAVSQGA